MKSEQTAASDTEMRKQSLGAFRWGRGGGTDAVLGPGHAFPTQCVNVLRSQAEFFLGLETEWTLRCCLPLVMAETVSLDRGCGGRGPSGKKPWTWSPPAAPAAPFLSSCHLLSSPRPFLAACLLSSGYRGSLLSLKDFRKFPGASIQDRQLCNESSLEMSLVRLYHFKNM